MAQFTIRDLSDTDLETLLKREEDFHFDCKDKRKKPADLLSHVVGFANARGGKLVVGMKDRKEGEGRARIAGFVRPEANNYISTLTREAEPPVHGLRFTLLKTASDGGRDIGKNEAWVSVGINHHTSQIWAGRPRLRSKC